MKTRSLLSARPASCMFHEKAQGTFRKLQALTAAASTHYVNGCLGAVSGLLTCMVRPCRLLGHEVEAQALRVAMPARLSAPGLPELNHSQVSAVQSVLQAPLSLIQGAPAAARPASEPVSAVIRCHLMPGKQATHILCLRKGM